MKSNTVVDLVIYTHDVQLSRQIEKSYKLRIIGLVTDTEVAKIKKEKNLLSKVCDSPTIKLGDIALNEHIKDFRLAGIIHAKNGVPVTEKTLFVSERIDLLNQVECTDSKQNLHRLMLSGNKGSFMIAEEHGKIEKTV
jgi:hypothetical protein